MSNPFLNELQTVLQQLGGPVNSSHSQAGSWAEDSVGSWDGPVDAGSQTGGIVSQVPSAMSNALDVWFGLVWFGKSPPVWMGFSPKPFCPHR